MDLHENTERPIRTATLKLLVSKRIGVKRFRVMSKRTRLKSENDLEKVKKHIKLWHNYGWLQ